MNVVESNGQIFEERFVGGFAVRVGRVNTGQNQEKRRHTDYKQLSHFSPT
jgi:hypothetical protein